MKILIVNNTECDTYKCELDRSTWEISRLNIELLTVMKINSQKKVNPNPLLIFEEYKLKVKQLEVYLLEKKKSRDDLCL